MIEITNLSHLNRLLEEFIQSTFEDILKTGTGNRESSVQTDTYLTKPLHTFIYHIVLKTVIWDKIDYSTMKIRTIYLDVRRQMLNFIQRVMCIEEDDHSLLGTVEEKLLGYYVYAYLHEKLI